ncbi:hypothetical protein ACJIZ3_020176 [Penstemon smallii]|uniref:Uncharacterized protein n=1 Tax=Penstemon smallii TaxID=265156 RepID=A0ABD3SHV3_9LAMI
MKTRVPCCYLFSVKFCVKSKNCQKEEEIMMSAFIEPTKLATKLYVVCETLYMCYCLNPYFHFVDCNAFMAMETIIKQHNLDIDTLMSSCLPLAAETQTGDSTSSQLAGK